MADGKISFEKQVAISKRMQRIARHISSKHPDIDNVVNFDAPKVVA